LLIPAGMFSETSWCPASRCPAFGRSFIGALSPR
jgi:hypothetical protein